MMFLLRILQMLLWLLLICGGLAALYFIFSWTIIGALEALGYNNSLIVKWLKSKLPKRKRKVK
jgi:hypothetical protein